MCDGLIKLNDNTYPTATGQPLQADRLYKEKQERAALIVTKYEQMDKR